MEYKDFIKQKSKVIPPSGITPKSINANLFDFQKDIVSWGLKRGRSALFAGTGLGKSLMQLSWAHEISAHEKKQVIIFTPLAVAAQMKREAIKFGIDADHVSKEGESNKPIIITNYQKLQHFDMKKYCGVVLDESSILKHQSGKYRTELIEKCASIPYRIAATATPAPNDFMELGNHSQFCGIMSYTDMLSTFFVHDAANTQEWRLKGHAEEVFWKWMASWSVMLRHPKDLGYNTHGYDLPKLHKIEHTVDVEYKSCFESGMLFPMQAQTMEERLKARRSTIKERIAKAIEVVYETESKLHSVMFSDKLAECLGNQNTHKTEKENTLNQKVRDCDEKNKQEPVKKTSNICKNITKTTKKNLSEHLNKEIKSTQQEGKNINQTQNMQINVNQAQKEDALKKEEKKDYRLNTELELMNTNPCIMNRAENVKYAEQKKQEEEQNISELTIATPQEKSEGCYATHVTSALVSSTIAQKNSIKQVNTLKIHTTWVIWVNLNSEQDMLEAAFGNQCISVRGSDTEIEKEESLNRWLNGERPILITKPSICGFGMNFQHCHNTIFVGLNDSFEQIYQAIRRFWRFGQKNEVYAHFIASEIEGAVVANIARKEQQAEHMANQMIKHMSDLTAANIKGATRETLSYLPQQKMELPQWIM